MIGAVVAFVVASGGLASNLPVALPPAVEPSARVSAILAGSSSDALSGDDVLLLERHVGDATSVVRLISDAVDDAANAGCNISSDEASSQLSVGRRLLAVALLEAAKGRGGTAMALSTSVDFASALSRCLPFGIATSVGKELALSTASLATYLRTHSVGQGAALDDADAAALATSLQAQAPEQANSLQRPAIVIGALVLAPASVLCRNVGARTVLSAGEAREIGRRYQARTPNLMPEIRNGRVVGLRVPMDAFFRSCGFVDGDVAVSVNGVDINTPDRVFGLQDKIARDRQAVVVVLRGGGPVTLTISEDRGEAAAPSSSPSLPALPSPARAP